MKAFCGPIRSTIIWGLIGALFYIPLGTASSLLVIFPVSLQLTLWAFLAGYGVLLTRWSSTPLRSIALPFLLLFTASIFSRAAPVFLFSALFVLGWVRSAVCFKKQYAKKRLGAEIILGSATALLGAGAVPMITPAWALGVLMFFLIQALYFVLLDPNRDPQIKIETDRFEKAKTAAENILDCAQKEIII